MRRDKLGVVAMYVRKNECRRYGGKRDTVILHNEVVSMLERVSSSGFEKNLISNLRRILLRRKKISKIYRDSKNLMT